MADLRSENMLLQQRLDVSKGAETQKERLQEEVAQVNWSYLLFFFFIF
jgi:hypothetical protein